VSDPDESKTPLEHVLDVCVYAPLGFALEARSLLPKFVDRGRNQIVLARVVGKYAVRKGSRATESRFNQAQEQVVGVLRLVSSSPDDMEPSSNGTEGSAAGTAPDGTPTNGEHPTMRPPVAVVPRVESTIDPSTLAIHDYDALSASQVVPRLESLTTDELEAVRDYEAGTRGRKTILNKIAQLQSS
jgi:hypothetical protein